MKKRMIRSGVVSIAMLAAAAGASGQVITRVNVTPLGGQSTGGAASPSISADGRYVVFASPAGDLVSGDTNGKWDVFVRDLQTGTTQLVSQSTGGAKGNDDSGYEATYAWHWRGAVISTDGRYVAFISAATNLIDASTDPNSDKDVFVRDLVSGTTIKLPGTTYARGSLVIAPDGHHVFAATDLGNVVWEKSSGTTSSTPLITMGWSKDGTIVGSTDLGPPFCSWLGVVGPPAAPYLASCWPTPNNLILTDLSDDGLNVLLQHWSISAYRSYMATGVGPASSALSAGVSIPNWSSLIPSLSPSGYYVAAVEDQEIKVIERDSFFGTPHVINEGYDAQPFTQYFDAIDVANDATVVLTTMSTNLLPSDTNGEVDVFLIKDLAPIEHVDVELCVLIDSSGSMQSHFADVANALSDALKSGMVTPRGQKVALRVDVFSDLPAERIPWAAPVCPQVLAGDAAALTQVTIPSGTIISAAFDGSARTVDLNGIHSQRKVLLLIGDDEASESEAAVQAASLRATAYVDDIYAIAIIGTTGVPDIYDNAIAGNGIIWKSDSGTIPIAAKVADALRHIFSTCAADVTGDGVVDFGDYLEYGNLFEAEDCKADMNGDGVFDFTDQLDFINAFNAGC